MLNNVEEVPQDMDIENYTFRLQSLDLELIGYDSNNNRSLVNNDVSINLLKSNQNGE